MEDKNDLYICGVKFLFFIIFFEMNIHLKTIIQKFYIIDTKIYYMNLQFK